MVVVLVLLVGVAVLLNLQNVCRKQPVFQPPFWGPKRRLKYRAELLGLWVKCAEVVVVVIVVTRSLSLRDLGIAQACRPGQDCRPGI